MELKTVWTEGHTQTVLCLGVNADGRVASGGEGGEVCLWSPEGKVVSRKTFPSGADVNSVCFSPRQPSLLYLSAGEVIEMVDIRCADASMATFAYNKDDINQLAMDPKDAFLAACDDDGIIKVIDVQNRKVFRTLKGHDNICSSVAVHPKAPREIASGGLDCFVHTWEVTRGRPLTSVNMQELVIAGEDSEAPSPYMINPPFVHSVDFSGTGDRLACGLENARIQLLERKGKRTLSALMSLEGHTLGVTQVCFLPDYPGQTPNLLLSAGNDCRLILWDTDPNALGAVSSGKRPKMPVAATSGDSLLADPQLASRSKAIANNERRADGSAGETASAASVSSQKLPRFCKKHKDKINWIAPICTAGAVNMVLVADVSSVISVYQWQ